MEVTQVTRGSHGKATIQWAETLLLSGEAPAEVARLTGIKPGYARKIKYRLFSGEKSYSLQPAHEHDSEVIRDFVALKTVTELETPVTNVTETVKVTGYGVTILDVVFYSTTLTACAGIVTALKWWGLPVSLVYSLILVDSMNKAKDVTLEKSAKMGAGMVIVFEIIAACVHAYFFNSILWANYKALPFDMREKIVNGVYSFPNADKPFLIAAGIAVVLSGSAIYAIENSILTARERAKKLAK